MGSQKIRCFTYDLKLNKNRTNKEYLKGVIEKLFDNSNVKTISYGNKAFIFKGNDNDNYLSLEYLNTLGNIDVDENYLFFRIGREKDIEGAVKRNLQTYEGMEIIDIQEQGNYNLEICTYILIDLKEGIILELYGRYAPTVKSFDYILNKSFQRNDTFEGLEFEFKNIISQELINALIEDGVNLGKIKYKYELPDASILNTLGLDDVQIEAIRNLDIFQVELELRARDRTPLTTKSEKIKHAINALKKCPEKIKKSLKVYGKTKNTSSKEYTFREEEVTFNIDIPSVRKEDKLIIKLSLDEIALEAYTRIKYLYEGKNKERVLQFIANS